MQANAFRDHRISRPRRGTAPPRTGTKPLAGDDARQIPVLEAALCFAWLIGSWELSTVWPSPWWSVLAVGSFGWAALIAMRIEPRGTILLLPIMIGQVSAVASLALIAFGTSMPELGIVGAPGGHGTSFVFYSVSLWIGYLVVFSAIHSKLKDPGADYPLTGFFNRYADLLAIGFLLLCGLMIGSLLLSGLRTGFPLFTGTDRFLYRRTFAVGPTAFILNFKFIISLVLGAVSFSMPTSKLVRLASRIIFVVMMVLYSLFGDKFFSMIAAVAAFFLPYLYLNAAQALRWLGRFVLVGATGLLLALGFTWFIYSNGLRDNPSATMERLSSRIVGQGELWFLQYQIGAPVWTYDARFVRDNILILKVKQDGVFAQQNSLGPNYFSNRYSPDRIRASIARQGGSVTLTQAMEPLALAVFGWGGLIVVMLMAGAISAAILIYMGSAIRSGSIVALVGSAFISTQLRTVLSQGTPWILFSIYSLKWSSLIIAVELTLYVIGATQRSEPARRSRMR